MSKPKTFKVKTNWGNKFRTGITVRGLEMDYSFLGKKGKPPEDINKTIDILVSNGYEIIEE